MIRAGTYAVVDGVTGRASVQRDSLFLTTPDDGPLPERWEHDARAGVHFREVPRSIASRIFHVWTTAVLDGSLPVQVRELDTTETSADVWADLGGPAEGVGAPSAKRRVGHPAHRDLWLFVEHGSSPAWRGTVSVDRLSEVSERVEEIPVGSQVGWGTRWTGGANVVRAGTYAVVDGVTYRALLEPREIFVETPDDQPSPKGWLHDLRRGVYHQVLPRSAASELFQVWTSAVLDRTLQVKVRESNAAGSVAEVCADYPGTASVEEQRARPLHPDLSPADNLPGTREWCGPVWVGRLTDVVEQVEKIPVDSDQTEGTGRGVRPVKPPRKRYP